MFTTEQAREYFKPLTYDDISKSDWRQLITILEKHIEQRNKEQLEIKARDGYSDYIYEISRCVWNKATKQKGKSAYIHVKVDNYSEREGISFNPNGFIGFAGWASSYNVKLFIEAFMEWVDWKKSQLLNNFQSLNNFKQQFPQNPLEGQIFVDNDTRYIYHNGWQKVYNPIEVLEDVKILVQKANDCDLKTELLKIL